MIREKKEEISVHELCGNLPLGTLKFVLYAKNMQFEETPNYRYLKNILRETMREKRFAFDYDFDWIVKYKNEKISP